MKFIFSASVVALSCVIAESAMAASASCPGPSQAYPDPRPLIENFRVCAKLGGDQWQEAHMPNGDLIDFKRGPNHPTDPSEKVGTWETNGKVVTYHYTGGKSYSYRVRAKRGSLLFCGVTDPSKEILASRMPANLNAACPQ